MTQLAICFHAQHLYVPVSCSAMVVNWLVCCDNHRGNEQEPRTGVGEHSNFGHEISEADSSWIVSGLPNDIFFACISKTSY